METAAGAQERSASVQAVADRGVGRLVIAVRGAGQQPHPVAAGQLAGAWIIGCDPAAVDVSGQKVQRRIDLTVGQEVRVTISEGQQSHPPENTRRTSDLGARKRQSSMRSSSATLMSTTTSPFLCHSRAVGVNPRKKRRATVLSA